jgi:hypothetical protein
MLTNFQNFIQMIKKNQQFMRRFWLLSLWAFVSLSSVNAQPLRPYVPMAIEGAHWAMDLFQTDGGRVGYVNRLHYLVHGDSVVNGRLYKKLFLCPKLIALLRDDTLTRKVMILQLDTPRANILSSSICPDVRETLLYDFNLAAGDSLKNCWRNNFQSNWYNVRQVVRNDTITLFGKNRNVLRCSNFSSTSYALVDGIGNYRSGIFPHDWIFETYFQLAYYNVLNVSGCEDPRVGLTDIQNPILEAHVFPNPATNYIQFTWQTLAPSQTFLTLYDAAGKMVAQQSIEMGATQTQIAIENQPNGLYFYKLTFGNRFAAGKVLIER